MGQSGSSIRHRAATRATAPSCVPPRANEPGEHNQLFKPLIVRIVVNKAVHFVGIGAIVLLAHLLPLVNTHVTRIANAKVENLRRCLHYFSTRGEVNTALFDRGMYRIVHRIELQVSHENRTRVHLDSWITCALPISTHLGLIKFRDEQETAADDWFVQAPPQTLPLSCWL